MNAALSPKTNSPITAETSDEQPASVKNRAGARGLSMPAALLHLEGIAVVVAAVTLYAVGGYSWWLFALLILAPDLAMAGYAFGPKVGAVVYNIVHTYALPVALGVAGLLTGWSLALPLALIWMAHIGIDRTLGYGLKYADGFKHTHLQEC